jgi:hypothetical protein
MGIIKKQHAQHPHIIFGEQELPGHATNYNCTCGYCRNMPTAKEEFVARKRKIAGQNQWHFITFA